MIEIAIAGALLAALTALGLGAQAGADAWVVAGFRITALGMAFGVPTGLVYHVALARALRAAGRLPAGWWWHPTALHPLLPREARPRVLAWCGAGALGFAVAVVGCLVTGVGVVRML